MNGRGIGKISSMLLTLLLLLSLPVSASAARPEDEPLKGTTPASSLETEAAYFGNAEDFEPESVDVDTLFIGLSYDKSAAEEVALENAEGLGFRFGYYDDRRVFRSFGETDASELLIRCERSWYLLLDEIYADRQAAEAVAGRYAGRAVTLDGKQRVLVGPFQDVEEVDFTIRWYALSGQTWRESCLVVYDGAGHFIDLYANAEELAIEAVSNGKARTYYEGEEYYGAFLLRRWAEDRLTVVNAVGLEDYVKGVIPYEMSPSWPVEALKAQAVCARSYAAWNLNAYAEDYGFDLTDDTESQVYRGIRGADAVTDAAAEATAGLFVRYRGRLCEVYYFASDGGTTEDGINIFGSDQPYLVGKTDPYEPAMDFAVMRWERWRSGEDVAERLRKKGYEIGTVVKLEPVYSELGNVIGMRYYDEQGTCLALDTRDAYTPLSLDSACFTVAAEDDGFRFTGTGWGHNCGMSQWGAHAMASVYGMSADEIIGFYFTGAYIG